ncbi:MAG: allophanate hydrolase [Betaproteobacteria bacterium]|nr:allophanate hydrolase [Betaproteobacteria bacterium]
MTILQLLEQYRSGSLIPQKYLVELLSRLRRDQESAPDPAWICLASNQQLIEQLIRLEGKRVDDLPLYGIPFAIKDNIDVAGWITTVGCPDFAYEAKTTATSVQKLLDAGAVLIGKTNLDQFATGLVGTRSPYGIVPNPFDPKFVSGGSSSGSGSVVSRGLVLFSLGTDTAGSGRIPAAFTNTVGTKPTPGYMSTEGVYPACKTIDCISIFTLTASDAAIVLDVMKATTYDRTHEPQYHPEPKLTHQFPRPIRVGIPKAADFLDNSEYPKLFANALNKSKGMGYQIVEVDITPFVKAGKLLYEGPWVAERYAVIEDFLKKNPNSMDPSVKQIIESGANYTAAQGFRATYQLKELETLCQQVWAQCDLIVVPSAPRHPTIQELSEEPILRNSELGMYTNYVNLMRLAAVAVPTDFTASGIPFGITLIGQGGSDFALLDFASQWQQLTQLPLGKLKIKPAEQYLRISKSKSSSTRLAVVGAHLKGMPLHSQLAERNARFIKSCKTAKHYQLFALANTTPPKPGLVRLKEGGDQIELELYDVPQEMIGSFLNLIPAPLGLGTIELDDGSWVKGFICEPVGIVGATNITHYGGWKNYLKETV